jgi:ABC-type lipoprotein export system ATPase subunit
LDTTKTDLQDSAFLKAEHLGKSYPGPQGPVWVLRDINLSIKSGESVSLTGPSGSGKSTLLNIFGLLTGPSEGRLQMAGAWLDPKQQGSAVQLRAELIGFVFQKHLLLPELSLLENVCLPLARRKGWGPATLEQGRLWLDKLGILARQHARPQHLSGGEAQRGAIARALIHSPPLLLLDEPTGNLDPEMSLGMVTDLLEVCKKQIITCVFVTHNLQLAALTERRMDLARHQLLEVAP